MFVYIIPYCQVFAGRIIIIEQALKRKPLYLTITKKSNKRERGIGAIVEKTFSDATIRNNDGSKTQTVIFKATINIMKNKFGEQFVINYGTREERGKAIALWTLNGIMMVAQPDKGASKFAVWVYTGVSKGLPVLLWFSEGYNAFSTKYSPYNLYQPGGKIEDKLVIKTTTSKDGHIYEKIKGTYSVWGKSSIPTVECYYNREGII